MNKKVTFLVSLGLLGTTSLAVSSLLQAIFPKPALAEGATVIKEFGCVLSPDASGLPYPLFSNEKTQSVITPSGNTKLTCKFDVPEDIRPSQATVNQGFPCGTFLGVATDSKAVVSPGGTAILTCQVKGN